MTAKTAKLKNEAMRLCRELKKAYKERREQPPRQSPVIAGFARGLTSEPR